MGVGIFSQTSEVLETSEVYFVARRYCNAFGNGKLWRSDIAMPSGTANCGVAILQCLREWQTVAQRYCDAFGNGKLWRGDIATPSGTANCGVVILQRLREQCFVG